MSLLRTVKTVLWSFIGIRKRSGYEEDLGKANPFAIIAVALVLVACFIGGLIAAASFALMAIAFGVRRSRRTLRANPRTLIAIGLLAALGSGTFGLVGGRPFMSAYWVMLEIPLLEEVAVGTPFLFDCGVYLVVLGVTMTIIFSLAEES